MSRRERRGDEIIADINITPFTDVVLVLLIIFMVAAPYIPKSALPLKLPESAQSPEIDDNGKKVYDIIVLSSAEVILNESTIEIEALEKNIELIKAAATAEVFTVSAEGAASYQQVIKILDILKKQDIKDVYLKTESYGGRSDGF